jgi:hypothetical protein
LPWWTRLMCSPMPVPISPGRLLLAGRHGALWRADSLGGVGAGPFLPRVGGGFPTNQGPAGAVGRVPTGPRTTGRVIGAGRPTRARAVGPEKGGPPKRGDVLGGLVRWWRFTLPKLPTDGPKGAVSPPGGKTRDPGGLGGYGGKKGEKPLT